MREQTIAASEMGERFERILGNVENGRRIAVKSRGRRRAYLISAEELESLDETLAVLGNQSLVKSIARGIEDLRAGRVHPMEEVFAEMNAETKTRGSRRVSRERGLSRLGRR